MVQTLGVRCRAGCRSAPAIIRERIVLSGGNSRISLPSGCISTVLVLATCQKHCCGACLFFFPCSGVVGFFLLGFCKIMVWKCIVLALELIWSALKMVLSILPFKRLICDGDHYPRLSFNAEICKVIWHWVMQLFSPKANISLVIVNELTPEIQ